MIRLRLVSALSLLLCASSWSPSLAQTWSTKPFDATYEIATGGRIILSRTINDGQGHQRQESSTPQGKVISILDYPNKVMWNLMEAQKMAMKLPLNPSSTHPSITDQQSAKRSNAKSLGNKVIDGHPCQGWQASTQGMTSETWIGTDINNLVYAVSSGPQGQQTTRLKQFSAATPSASLFAVPPGYKVMALPAGMPGMR